MMGALDKVRVSLQGWKVYLLAGAALLNQLVKFADGDVTLSAFLQWLADPEGALGPLIVMAVRAAIAKAENKKGA